MNLESIILNDTSQSEKDKYYMASLYMGSKEHIKGTNKIETDSSTQRADWWLPEETGVGGLGKRAEEIKKHTLAVINGHREILYAILPLNERV